MRTPFGHGTRQTVSTLIIEQLEYRHRCVTRTCDCECDSVMLIANQIDVSCRWEEIQCEKGVISQRAAVRRIRELTNNRK